MQLSRETKTEIRVEITSEGRIVFRGERLRHSLTSSIPFSTGEILLQNLKHCSDESHEGDYQSHESQDILIEVGHLNIAGLGDT